MSESNKKRSRTLLIGVGGTGSNAVDLLYQRIDAMGNQSGNEITAIVFDTDSKDASAIKRATVIEMSDSRSLGEITRSMELEYLRDWFPVDSRQYDGQEMHKGASQWRKKSYLAFCNLMNNSTKRSAFERALESLVDRENSNTVYEIYIVASIAGGTGSGSFIPIAMYAKQFLKERFHISAQTFAMLACPDIYQECLSDPDQRVKVFSNAYAILRELNAMNLVAAGYNDPKMSKQKHAPVQFRLGHKGNPYVGNLFDSADPKFWGPDAAPFQGIYLLDKVPGLSSVKAHDSIMANSLYTVLCTDIGRSFDSEKSNQAAKLSERSNASAIYAGISSTQVCYPLLAVVDYIATQKAYDASAGEWTVIHRATEATIEEQAKLAREMRQAFFLARGEYAAKLLLEVEEQEKEPYSNISQLLRRSIYNITTDGKGKPAYADRVEPYIESLMEELENRLRDASEVDIKEDLNGDAFFVPKCGVFASRSDKEDARKQVSDNATKLFDSLNEYYADLVMAIRNQARSLADAILPASFDKSPTDRPAMSLTENLLKKEGRYIHPVAAMVMLCKLQQRLLAENFAQEAVWSDIKSFAEPDLGNEDALLDVKENSQKGSRYSEMGKGRFRTLAGSDPADYMSKDSNTAADSDLLKEDALAILDRIQREASRQMQIAVLTVVEERLNVLIEKYRSFFNRFEEAREDLQMMAKSAKRVGIATQDDIINLSASEADKEAAYAEYNGTGVASADSLAASDDVTGSSVFMMAFDGMRESFADEPQIVGKKDSFAQLFSAMIGSYRQEVLASDFYKKRVGKNVLEVIVDSCGRDVKPEDMFKRVGDTVRHAIEKARPSLKVSNFSSDNARSAHHEIQVVLMSKKTAMYLKKNAEQFGLSGDDERAVAETFLGKAGITSAIIAITPDLPDNVLYVTCKTDCIRPDCISKIDELSDNPVYYREYQKALERMTQQETDMWNPHLGANLHKHGYLPFINASLNEKSDLAFAKAFLYALMKGKLTYKSYPRQTRKVFWYDADGRSSVIMVPNGKGGMEEITIQEINKLLPWLRVQENLISEWSKAFDVEVEAQCKSLPTMMALDSQELSSKISQAPIVKALRDDVMWMGQAETTKEEPAAEETQDGTKPARKKLSFSLLELAYRIKVLEESERDCDDAEKILAVGYEALLKLCKAKIADGDEAALAQIYYHQLRRFVDALYNDEDTQEMRDPYAYVTTVMTWANDNECFMSPEIGKPWTPANVYELLKNS